MVTHGLTIDLESWRDTEAVRQHARSPAGDERHDEPLARVLDLLAQHDVRATFFVLGKVAASRPDLVHSVAAAGHHVASHGYSHATVEQLGPDRLREELIRTKALLEDLVGRPVDAHRCPTWTLGRNSLWALEVMADCGFRYDASVRAGRNPAARIGTVPEVPHRIRLADGREMREFPGAVAAAWLPLPFAGGLFLRALPGPFVRACFRDHHRRGVPVTMYAHPWEFDREPPRVKLPLTWRLVHYSRLAVLPQRFGGLLRRYRFAPLAHLAEQIDWSRTPVWQVPATADGHATARRPRR